MEKDNHYDEYEIDLVEYLYLLYKNKFMIMGITLLSIFIAAFASFVIMEESYKSELTFIAPNFKLVNGESVNKDEYINFFQKNQLLEEISNSYYPDKDSNSFLTNKLKITREDENRFIKLSFTENDPELAASILNDWFDKFSNEVYNYLETNNNNYLSSLENKKDNDYQQYINDLTKYNQFQAENNISLMKSRLSRKENRLVNLEENIIDLNNNLKNKNVELGIVQQQLKRTDKFLVREESISNQSLNKLQSINPDHELINLLTTKNEFLNPQYNNLTNRENSINQQISVLKSDLENKRNEIENLRNEIISLEEKIINLEEQQEVLNNELKNSRNNYQTAVNQYENNNQSLAGKNYTIDIISQANINEIPVSPNKKLNIAIAAVLGLMLSVFLVFFKEFINNADLSKYES